MTGGGILTVIGGARPALAQPFHDFHGMGGGMGIAYWISALLGVLFILGVLALMIAVAWRLFRGGRDGGGAPSPTDAGPLDILERRYARGDIEREEYLQKRDDLTRS